jgi:hypothetical protein
MAKSEIPPMTEGCNRINKRGDVELTKLQSGPVAKDKLEPVKAEP